MCCRCVQQECLWPNRVNDLQPRRTNDISRTKSQSWCVVFHTYELSVLFLSFFRALISLDFFLLSQAISLYLDLSVFHAELLTDQTRNSMRSFVAAENTASRRLYDWAAFIGVKDVYLGIEHGKIRGNRMPSSRRCFSGSRTTIGRTLIVNPTDHPSGSHTAPPLICVNTRRHIFHNCQTMQYAIILAIFALSRAPRAILLSSKGLRQVSYFWFKYKSHVQKCLFPTTPPATLTFSYTTTQNTFSCRDLSPTIYKSTLLSTSFLFPLPFPASCFTIFVRDLLHRDLLLEVILLQKKKSRRK